MPEPNDRNAATCDGSRPVVSSRKDADLGGFACEIVVSSPRWVVNGVNIFSELLVRGLRARNVSAHLLLTGSSDGDAKPMELPRDIPVHQLPVENLRSRRARWQCMIDYLKDRAPCIYIPNHDFEYSCVVPALPRDVGVVGVIHSDDPQHYAHAHHLGRFWNATVAVSQNIEANLASSNPELTARLKTIHHGVSADSELRRSRRDGSSPLRIVYVGRLVEQQKRVFDLPRVMEALDRRGIPASLTVVGGGEDRQALESLAAPWVERGAIRFAGILSSNEIAHELRHHDVSILTSAYEGLPLSTLEAMAWGCIPVVTAIRSGIPELVSDGENGYQVDVGDIEAFAERLAGLQRNAKLCERLSECAFETLHQGGFTAEAMTDRYLDLFHGISKELSDGAFQRPSGRIEQLPWARTSWKDQLPPRVRRALARAKQLMGG
jgi:glycosyltransferase involved in cell wall biosynthesis